MNYEVVVLKLLFIGILRRNISVKDRKHCFEHSKLFVLREPQKVKLVIFRIPFTLFIAHNSSFGLEL